MSLPGSPSNAAWVDADLLLRVPARLPWSAEAEERLYELYLANVAQYGQARYDLIAPHFPDRSRQACMAAVSRGKCARGASARATRGGGTAPLGPAGPTPAAAARPHSSAHATSSAQRGSASLAVPAPVQPRLVQPGPASVSVGAAALQAGPAVTASAPAPPPAGAPTGNRPWTEEENEDLINAVRSFSNSVDVTPEQWAEIGETLDRKSSQCAVQYGRLFRAGRPAGGKPSSLKTWVDVSVDKGVGFDPIASRVQVRRSEGAVRAEWANGRWRGASRGRG